MKYIAIVMIDGRIRWHKTYHDSTTNEETDIEKRTLFTLCSLDTWKKKMGSKGVQFVRINDRQLEELEELQRKDSSLLSWMEDNFPEVLLFIEEVKV